jgi:hypothetical protein
VKIFNHPEKRSVSGPAAVDFGVPTKRLKPSPKEPEQARYDAIKERQKVVHAERAKFFEQYKFLEIGVDDDDGVFGLSDASKEYKRANPGLDQRQSWSKEDTELKAEAKALPDIHAMQGF